MQGPLGGIRSPKPDLKSSILLPCANRKETMKRKAKRLLTLSAILLLIAIPLTCMITSTMALMNMASSVEGILQVQVIQSVQFQQFAEEGLVIQPMIVRPKVVPQPDEDKNEQTL